MTKRRLAAALFFAAGLLGLVALLQPQTGSTPSITHAIRLDGTVTPLPTLPVDGP